MLHATKATPYPGTTHSWGSTLSVFNFWIRHSSCLPSLSYFALTLSLCTIFVILFVKIRTQAWAVFIEHAHSDVAQQCIITKRKRSIDNDGGCTKDVHKEDTGQCRKVKRKAEKKESSYGFSIQMLFKAPFATHTDTDTNTLIQFGVPWIFYIFSAGHLLYLFTIRLLLGLSTSRIAHGLFVVLASTFCQSNLIISMSNTALI